MTAYQLLLHELAQHGQTTYAALCKKYPAYDYYCFTSAVLKARRLGIVAKSSGHGTPIVAIGCCPCCGRKLWATPLTGEKTR